MVLSTIALLVLFASIFILFSEELRSSAKKIINNNKIRFFSIALFISMLALEYDRYVDMVALQLRTLILYILINCLHRFHNVHLWELMLGEILILSIIAFIPIFIGKNLAKISFIKKKSPNLNKIIYIAALYLWVICSMVLVVHN